MDPDDLLSEQLERWVIRKSTARAAAAEQVPRRMVSSFTDQQPAHGWTSQHALREFWQNFKDGLREQFCSNSKELQIDMHAEPGNDVFKAYFGTREVGYINAQTPNQLEISQSHCILSLEALQLASFKRSDGENGETIGGHGEGFKVGINLLLRHGFSVTYSMPFATWYFSLQNVYSDRCRNMVIDIVPHDSERDDMLILIEGQSAHTLFDPETDLQLTPELREECNCKSGSMYSSRFARHFGRIYCRGLYVASDDDFKHLELVVNLNSHIARDRHLLPGNTWNLIEDILNEVSQREHAPLLLHLLTICRNLDENMLRKSLAYIKPPLRKHIAFLNHILEQDVVFIRNDSSPFEQLLRDLGKFVVSGAGALADAIDAHNLKQQYVMSRPCMELSALKAIERVYYDAFRTFRSALQINFSKSFNDNVLVKDIPASLADVLPVCEGDSMIIPRLLLASHEEVVFLVLLAIQKFSFGDRVIQSKLFMEFSKDPLHFVPRKLDILNVDDFTDSPVTTAAGSGDRLRSDGQSGAVDSNTNTGTSMKRDIEYDDSNSDHLQSLGQESNEQERGIREGESGGGGGGVHSDEPDPRIRNSTFNGVPIGPLDVGGESGIQRTFPACSKHLGSLVPALVGDHVVYFGDTMLHLNQDNNQFMIALTQSVPVINQLVTELKGGISRTLNIADQNFPVILVVVTDTILGFTDGGGVYLNCKPLLGINYNKMKKSIFFTLIHELTHRTSSAHDAYFASEYGKLVLLACDCVRR